jgi:hypothetical protein
MKRSILFSLLSIFVTSTFLPNSSLASRRSIHPDIIEATKKWSSVRNAFTEAVEGLSDKIEVLETVLNHPRGTETDPLILDGLFSESSYPEVNIIVSASETTFDIVGLHLVRHYKGTLEKIRDNFADNIKKSQLARTHLESLRDGAAQIHQFCQIMKYVNFQLIYKFLGYKPYNLSWREECIDIETAISNTPLNLDELSGYNLSSSRFERDQYLRAGFNSGTNNLPPIFLIGYYNEELNYCFQNLASGNHQTLLTSSNAVKKRMDKKVPPLKPLPSFVDTTMIGFLSENIPSRSLESEELLEHSPEMLPFSIDNLGETLSPNDDTIELFPTDIIERESIIPSLVEGFSEPPEPLPAPFIEEKNVTNLHEGMNEIKEILIHETDSIVPSLDDENLLDSEPLPITLPEGKISHIEISPIVPSLNEDILGLLPTTLPEITEEPSDEESLEDPHEINETLEELDSILKEFGRIKGMKTDTFLSFVAALQKLGYLDVSGNKKEVSLRVAPSSQYPYGTKTKIDTNHKPSNRRGKGEGLTRNSAKNIKRVLSAMRVKIEEDTLLLEEDKRTTYRTNANTRKSKNNKKKKNKNNKKRNRRKKR